MQLVQVTRKNVYGKDMLYPYNINAARFAALIGKKTFDQFAISKIQSLGFQVEVVADNGTVIEVL